MHIVACYTYFCPVVGGAENQLLRLATCWVQQGHRVTVLTRSLPEQPRREQIAGIDVKRVLDPSNRGPLFGLTFVSRLVRALHRHRSADVFLAYQYPWEAVACGLVRRLGRVRPTFVQSVNTGPFGDLQVLRRTRGSGLLRRIILANDHYFAMSQAMVAEFQELGARPADISFIPMGVDASVYHPPGGMTEQAAEERLRTVLFVGRLAEQKDPLNLLRAWRLVEGNVPGRLWLVGSGPLEAAVRQEIDRLGLRTVSLLGRRSDVPELCRQAGILVLASRSEGLANVLLEGMASGMCPVVSDIGGNRDLVRHGETGLLVPPGDPEALAAALTDVLQNPRRQRALASAAEALVRRHHRIEDIANRYVQAFERVCSRWRPAGRMRRRSKG